MGKICRNCHEKRREKDMIAPCMCSGTMKWVHRSCLDTWRTVSPRFSSFSECDVCHFKYRVQKKPLGMWPRISYILKIIRDVVFLLGIVAALVLIHGVICLFVERLSEYDKDFDPEVRDLFQNIYFQLFLMGFLATCFVSGILAILFVMFKGCGLCCDSCCDEPNYKYNSYSYNPCCDPWWCLAFYWWSPRYSSHDGCCNVCCDICFCCCDTHHHHNNDCCCCCCDDNCVDVCCCCCQQDCDCSSGGGGGGFGGCGDCLSCGDCGSCDDDAAAILLVLLVVIVVIIIIIGFFAGVGLFFTTLAKFVTNHKKMYKRKLDARELQVVDLDKHPEYIQDESAVINIDKLGIGPGKSETKNYKKSNTVEMSGYSSAPPVPVPVDPSVPSAPPAPVVPDYSYPAAPVDPATAPGGGGVVAPRVDDGDVDGVPLSI